MCGKFTAMASWRKVVAFSQPLEEAGDERVTYRVAGILPVIVHDREAAARKIVPMQWGFPHPRDPRRPQPIHARSETIDTTAAFAQAFRDGQRGIVAMRTFNEGEEVGSKTVQWTVEPADGAVRGLAFIWRRFEIEGRDGPVLACAMCTVPANALIAPITDRMPAVLEESDWPR
ncbi:MAG: SOS response-associated peptidase family protein, partial [Alphaproteobacteria bacterium]|nr:SOS response-associated peptidase family protein [Alphaproteobacteria bacterium]